MNIDPQKTKLAKEYKHSRPLTACHWSPASRFLFFGAEDNLVHRYELASGKTISLEAHDSWVRGFASSPDGKTLYSSSYDGKLGFWPADAEKPEPIRMIDAHAGWVRAVAVSPDGKLAATCGNDLLVKLWETSSGKLVKTFAGHKRHVYNVAFSQDSTAVFSCDLMGVVHRWTMDADKPQELVTVKALHKYDKTFRADIGGARGIALRDDGQQLALGGITNVSNAFAGVGEVAFALINVGRQQMRLQFDRAVVSFSSAVVVNHHAVQH